LFSQKNEINSLIGLPPDTLNTLQKLATALNNNPDFFNYVNQQLFLKRNVADSYDKNYINTLITNYYNKTQVDTLFNNIIDGAPTVLNTLNELAAALNDDANYATTIQNQIALKQDLLSVLSLPGQIGLLNGNLIKKLPFEGSLAYQNFQDLTLFSTMNLSLSKTTTVSLENPLRFNGAFSGSLSNLFYFAYALSYTEIQALTAKGISSKTLTKAQDMPPYLTDTYWTTSYQLQ
jgi:hypothetical protein